MTPAHPLSVLAPLPAAYALEDDYDRHQPDDDAVRVALRPLIARPRQAPDGWTELRWAELIEELLALGRTDIPLARLAEGHLDAARTAAQAGGSLREGCSYGVWASRSGATGLRATDAGDEIVLDGTLRFASGLGVLDRALVPVWTGEQHRLLDLAVDDVPVDRSAWQTGAMSVSRSHSVTVTHRPVPATILGGPDFYLRRPGFFPGGVGVAAVWAGGLARVVDTLLGWRPVDRQPLPAWRLGQLRIELAAAAAVVRQAGVRLDETLTPDAGPRHELPEGFLAELSTEARAVVAGAVHRGLDHVRALAGPAGLAFATDLTHAVDDLELYVRQQSVDGDPVALGRTLGTVA